MQSTSPAISETKTPRKLYLVDGYGFVFRAYHVMPPFTNPEGVPVGAVYGFTNMLIKLLADHKPDYMAVVFDAGKDTFRSDIYKDYKANRPDAPEDLKPQFALVRDAAVAMGLKTFELVNYEADDIIATYTKKAKEQGIEVTIISSDKDLMQLVDDGRVMMFDSMKHKYIREPEVIEKFGVPPSKVLDVLSLIGDSSDNVPGVPSIGPKTAAELVNQFGSLDEVLARADEIKQNKRREVIIAHREQALLSRKLIELHYDVPLDFNFEHMKAEPHFDTLIAFAKKHNFKSIVSKVENANLDTATSASAANIRSLDQPAPVIVPQAVVAKRSILKTTEELAEWLKPVRAAGKLAVCFVDGSGLALSYGAASCFVKFSGHDASLGFDFGSSGGLSEANVFQTLRGVLENPEVLKIVHDFKSDYMSGVAPIDDVQIMNYVLGTGLTDGSLEDIAPELASLDTLLGSGRNKKVLKDLPDEEIGALAMPISEFLFSNHSAVKQKLFNDRLLTVYEKIEKPLVGIIAEIEQRGAKIDRDMLDKMSAKFSEKMALLEAEIHKLAGKEFNVGSPTQLGVILFEDLKIEGGKKNKKTGNYSTDAQTLDELAEAGHEIAQKVLDWRQISKLKSTYTDALPKQINPKTGRVHTIFNMTTTSTGRLSSTEPNLQNIPIRSEEGKLIRNAFIAEKGKKIISADYSQIELRLLAHLADIKPLKEAFKNGQDIHAITAHQMFGTPVAEVTADQRRMAKTINFGIIYGVSAHGLSWRLKIPREQAAEYIKLYFQQYPGIKEYMATTVAFCKEHGYVETLYGRKCYIKGINDKNGAIRQFSERAAINAPLQGTAADIIKKAMIELKRQNLPMILQVHDELLFEVPEAEASEIAKKVENIMSNVAMFSVPITAVAHTGDNWGSAH